MTSAHIHDILSTVPPSDRAVAERVCNELAAAHLLRPRPWPPIPYPEDTAHQARWTMQRAFVQRSWETGDQNEGHIAAADALLDEGWLPPLTAAALDSAARLRAAVHDGGVLYHGWMDDLRVVLGMEPE